MIIYKNIVDKISVSSDKKTKQKNYLKQGKLPIIDQGHNLIGGYTDNINTCLPCDLPVIVFGDHTRAVKYIDFKFGVGADGVKVLRPKEGIFPKYLYYATLYLVLRLEDKGYARHYQHLEKKSIYVPDTLEQQRIVERIEEMFSQLDSAVETLNKTKQQLAVYRQAVLKEAFEGNLTKSWRIINSYKNEWKEVDIGYLIQNDKCALKAGPFGSSLKKECYVSNGYKIYGQEQVISGNENFGDYYINEQKYQELFSCRIKPYDVLISLVGTVGKVLILSEHCQPGIINPRLIKISLDKVKMIPKFFKYYFESDYLRSLYKSKVHGATMDVLNKGMIKELPFAWCPLEEQNQVVKEIESRLSICDNIGKTIDVALQQAEAMRQSILKKAFEGKL